MMSSTNFTADEIKKANTALSAAVNDGKEINPLGIYLIYNYESPYDLNLSEFLAYFPSEEDVTDETEFERLKKSEHWLFRQDAQLSTMPVPIHKFPTSVVDEKLKDGFGIGLKDLSYAQNGELMYSEEYDCFYNTTSDAYFGYFSCTEGYIDGNTAVLIGENRRLELHLEDGKWLFYSLTEISDTSDFADSELLSVAGLGLESNEVAPDGLNAPSNSDFALDAQRKEYMDILEKLEFSDITYLAVYLSPNDSSLKPNLPLSSQKPFLTLLNPLS